MLLFVFSSSYSTSLLQESPHKEDSANEGKIMEASNDEPLAYYGQRSRKKVKSRKTYIFVCYVPSIYQCFTCAFSVTRVSTEVVVQPVFWLS